MFITANCYFSQFGGTNLIQICIKNEKNNEMKNNVLKYK